MASGAGQSAVVTSLLDHGADVHAGTAEVGDYSTALCVVLLLHDNMKSTKVLNPRRCIMRVSRNTHARTREIRMEKWPTVRMAVQRRECWISATERFQRKPHKFFDLRRPLSM